MNVMGIIRLAPGRVGFYDDLTRIHLTLSNPQKPIYEGMNTANIKKAVRSRGVQLVSGSLDPVVIEQPIMVKPEVKVSQEEIKEVVKAKEIKEEIIETIEAKEVVEEVKEEVKKEVVKKETKKKVKENEK